MSEALTKKEICQKLRKRGWYRNDWLWRNLRPGSTLEAKQGLCLRDAASYEGLTASEDLTERPPRIGPSTAEWNRTAAAMALSRANIVTCFHCGWPAWQNEVCIRCGRTTS